MRSTWVAITNAPEKNVFKSSDYLEYVIILEMILIVATILVSFKKNFLPKFLFIYFFLLKGAVFNENLNKWVYYNDSLVSLKTSLLDIVDCQPYILFYKKIKSK